MSLKNDMILVERKNIGSAINVASANRLSEAALGLGQLLAKAFSREYELRSWFLSYW